MLRETRFRSVVKSITWRILAVIITWTVVYSYTGNVGGSLKITITAAGVSIITYYFHERIWNNIEWGKKFEL